MIGGNFNVVQFYADIEGHPDDPGVARALDEFDYFTSDITILGVYPADPRRYTEGLTRRDQLVTERSVMRAVFSAERELGCHTVVRTHSGRSGSLLVLRQVKCWTDP